MQHIPKLSTEQTDIQMLVSKIKEHEQPLCFTKGWKMKMNTKERTEYEKRVAKYGVYLQTYGRNISFRFQIYS